jgi:hypothetical protein
MDMDHGRQRTCPWFISPSWQNESICSSNSDASLRLQVSPVPRSRSVACEFSGIQDFLTMFTERLPYITADNLTDLKSLSNHTLQCRLIVRACAVTLSEMKWKRESSRKRS